MYNGIINIRKEAGFTSHDVVAKMRGILRQKKIGHTGTLDPEATGVLPVCLGTGTKLCDMLTDHDKEYVAELLLGETTDTQDVTGTVLSKKDVTCTEREVREAVISFVGEYDQIPPMYSALKVNGKKLYELAREGKEIERKARRVQILEIEILEIHLPVVKMRVACSKGTYIRTLCADIGDKLGCGGTMKSLVRTKVANFRLEDAITLAELEKIRDEDRVNEIMIGVEAVFADLPEIHAEPKFDILLDNGNSLYLNQTVENKKFDTNVRMKKSDGTFVGVYTYEAENRRYKPVKMFMER